MSGGHIPVLREEVVAALAPAPGEWHVDATFGGGGYTESLLEAGARVIAFDRDPEAIARGEALRRRWPGDLRLHQAPFSRLAEGVDHPVAGVAFDLGVSSFQLDAPARGFSFRAEAALDMRMDPRGPSAAEAVNALSEAALSELLFAYGEEPAARRIARAIVAARPLATTTALAATVERAVGGRKGARLHPATRTFQALRMLVNDELGELAAGLAAAEAVLAPGGRLVVVAFHSLEDRLVKAFLDARSGHDAGGSRHRPTAAPEKPASFNLPRRKAAKPKAAESAENARARSARLRLAVRTAAPAWGPSAPMEPAPRARAEWEAL